MLDGACVGCGDKDSDTMNHHCNPLKESRIENIRKMIGEQEYKHREPTLAQRLNIGLELLFPEEEA